MTTARSRVRRRADRGHYERDDVAAVLDAAIVAHVAFADENGQPFCIPFLHARIGHEVLIHGSTGSRALRHLATGAPACVTVTILDALVLAGSVFDHSANYRSATVLGSFRELDPDERMAAFHAFTERLLPGRWDEVRPPSRKEVAQTTVLAMPLDEASVKIRTGPPGADESPDALADVWTGIVALRSGYDAPQPAPGQPDDITVSPSVRSLVGRS